MRWLRRLLHIGLGCHHHAMRLGRWRRRVVLWIVLGVLELLLLRRRVTGAAVRVIWSAARHGHLSRQRITGL